MILFRVLVVLAVAPLASDAVAQDQAQRLKNAMNNVQQEMMSCAAFYTNYAACLAHSNYDQKTVVGMQGIADRFIDDGGRVAEVIGMTADAVVARLKVAQQDQMNLINRNCVNIASLTSRYQDQCEVILRDFKAVVNEYMK